MLTEQARRLIDKCIADGYGTRLFAISVMDRGTCTERQYETMQRLHGAAEYRRNNPPSRSSRETELLVAFGDVPHGELV